MSKIYHNNKNNTFTDQTSISLTGVSYSSSAWGDYDNDGYLDILLTGRNLSGTPISKIYHNNGDNTFTDQASISLTGVFNSSIAWGDYDNDGYLDILITGNSLSGLVSKIYWNDGNGSFSEQTTISLAGISEGSAVWGDYDNDGYLDILLAGDNQTKIYHNNKNNTFTDITSINIGAVSFSSTAWGDYDNDGDLDILLTGKVLIGFFNFTSEIHRNNNITSNTLASIPSNLKTTINGNEVTFSWDKSTDNETPQNGLTYNIAIGTSSGGCDILSPMSDRNTGRRKVINFGNTGHLNSKTIKNLSSGRYYWSVQAIDNNFAGSQFAGEKILDLTPTPAYVKVFLQGPYAGSSHDE